MSIQNNRAAEVLYSTTYVEDYLDTVENLPDEIQRLLSRLMLLDADSKKFFGQVRDYFAQLVRLKNRNRRSDNEDLTTEIGRIHGNITVTLMKSQEIGDEKIQVAQQIQDFVDNRLRQLEVDRKTLDSVQKQADAVEAASASPYSTRDRDVPQRLGSNDNIASERTMKRVRRVRLGPSIIPNKPSTVSASTALHQNIASNCEKQRPEVTSSSVGTSAPPPPEVSSSSTATSSAVTTVQSEKEKPKEKAKPTPQQHTPGPPVVTSEDKRRDSAASTLVSVLPTLPVKKRVNEVETVSTPVQELQPETPERKTDLVLRTPKKKEKKLSAVVQKQNERKASSGSTSSATKRTTAKRKAQQDGGISNADPDEATYCICVQISYGDMIGCDNDLCPIEWFHFSCVQLSSKPKGKWYCPSCRDGKANVMKPKEVFLKELEQYNREREGR